MGRVLYHISYIVGGLLLGLFVLNPLVSAAFPKGDDPGPHLQYGGTPIELHFDAPGANVTKVSVDGTPCIIVSWAEHKDPYTSGNPAIALSCNWNPR